MSGTVGEYVFQIYNDARESIVDSIFKRSWLWVNWFEPWTIDRNHDDLPARDAYKARSREWRMARCKTGN